MNKQKSGLKSKWKCKEVIKTEFPVLNKELLIQIYYVHKIYPLDIIYPTVYYCTIIYYSIFPSCYLAQFYCTDVNSIVTPTNKTFLLFVTVF